MKKILAMILAMVMALSLAACGKTEQKDEKKDDAAAAKTFIMGIDAEYPPFSYIDENGEYTGFDVEVCKAACDLLGWDMQVFPVNWDQKLVQLDANECDCVWSGMTILDSMKEAGYVLSAPYYDNTQVIMVKEGSDIKSSADLAGKVVAVQLGTSGEALLADGGDLADLKATFAELTTCDSFLKCFTELGGGAVEGQELVLNVTADGSDAVVHGLDGGELIRLPEVDASEVFAYISRDGSYVSVYRPDSNQTEFYRF